MANNCHINTSTNVGSIKPNVTLVIATRTSLYRFISVCRPTAEPIQLQVCLPTAWNETTESPTAAPVQSTFGFAARIAEAIKPTQVGL